MATFTTYDAVGIKEDVSDVISNISPTKTPFLSMIGRDKTKQRKFEWQEDSLRAVQDNAKIEGFDAADATLSPTVLRENRTQIFEKTIKVSGTEDAVDQYGRAKESAYQLVKAGQELKRDQEYAMIGRDQAAVAGNATDTARRMASASKMIDAAVTVTADGGSGAATALTEAHVLSAGQKAYTEGADPTVLMIKPADSLIVAGFTGASGRSRTFNDGQKTVTNAVNLYVSPFGEYKVALNRFQITSMAFLVDPEMWQEVTLRGWSREPLAKSGDSTKQMLVAEKSLKHKNFKASGLVKNLT